MSRNCWERGTIIIPVAAWPGIKTAVRAAWNMQQASTRKIADELYTKLKAAGAADHAIKWGAALTIIIDERWRADQNRTRYTTDRYDASADDALRAACNAVLPYERCKANQPPLKPHGKMFPDANGATKTFTLGEASITFNEAERTVTWYVPENNHAVERAHNHPVGRALFEYLRRIDWKRGSGGTVAGNDEYSRESHAAGAGSNYITHEFGPKTKTRAASARGRFA